MYRTARAESRRAAGGLLLSMALTSFLTGVTEPIEFTFMFLAPGLYAVHAVLTGLAMVTMDVLGVRLGFSFSAGFFDYVLNYGKSTHPLYLIPVGAIYFALYYFVFRWCILTFNLKTPGREAGAETAAAREPITTGGDDLQIALGYIRALGGAENLQNVAACTTRLRLELANRDRIDADALRRLGAKGTVRVGEKGLQVVVGPMADQVASAIRLRLNASEGDGDEVAGGTVLAALGGKANVRKVEQAAGRLIVTVADASRIDERALMAQGARGVAVASSSSVHVLHEDVAMLEGKLVPLLS